jgi:hypothetical protein
MSRGHDIDVAVAGAIIALRAQPVPASRGRTKKRPWKDGSETIDHEFDIYVDLKTCSGVGKRAERRAEVIDYPVLCEQSVNANRGGTGRHERLNLREKQALVKHATRDKIQRFKPWLEIYNKYVKLKLVKSHVSRPTIYKAFRSMGCERCIPRKELFLDEKQRELAIRSV